VNIYSIIILPLILYGYETWFLTLRKEHRLGVFESRMLRQIFGLQSEEVAGGWRRLHDELHNMNASPNNIKMIKLMK
jgi:hypothetical protein